MLKKTVMLSLLAIVLWSIPATAQTVQGSNEVALSGSYNNIKVEDNGHSELTTIAGEFGHFFTKELEFSALGGYSHASDATLFDVGAKGRWHFFTDNQIVPYVGGVVTFSHVNPDPGSTGSGLGFGPLGGAKFYINENAAIFLEYQIRWFSGDVGDAIDFQQNIFLGVSFFF